MSLVNYIFRCYVIYNRKHGIIIDIKKMPFAAIYKHIYNKVYSTNDIMWFKIEINILIVSNVIK